MKRGIAILPNLTPKSIKSGKRFCRWIAPLIFTILEGPSIIGLLELLPAPISVFASAASILTALIGTILFFWVEIISKRLQKKSVILPLKFFILCLLLVAISIATVKTYIYYFGIQNPSRAIIIVNIILYFIYKYLINWALNNSDKFIIYKDLEDRAKGNKINNKE